MGDGGGWGMLGELLAFMAIVVLALMGVACLISGILDMLSHVHIS